MSSEPTPRATSGVAQPAPELQTEQQLVHDLDRIVGVLCRALRHTLEAKRLVSARALESPAEVVTSAAFAAGDGATDADIAPGSERRSVRLWPAQ